MPPDVYSPQRAEAASRAEFEHALARLTESGVDVQARQAVAEVEGASVSAALEYVPGGELFPSITVAGTLREVTVLERGVERLAWERPEVVVSSTSTGISMVRLFKRWMNKPGDGPTRNPYDKIAKTGNIPFDRVEGVEILKRGITGLNTFPSMARGR